MITSLPAGISEIPLLLRGTAPPPSDPENIGTRNYAQKPAAVITGAGYGDDDIRQMREACEKDGVSNVPWLRSNIINTGQAPPGPDYAKVIVERVKKCLKAIKEGDQLGVDGVYRY